MIHKDYCSQCKAKDVPLMKDVPLIRNTKSKNGDIQYYRCRGCNNYNTKKYYEATDGVSFKETQRKMYTKYPEKALARGTVNYAVRMGKLSKPSSCEVCESPGRIEGHHRDYDNPLEVTWLCTDCHASYDKGIMVTVETKMRETN